MQYLYKWLIKNDWYGIILVEQIRGYMITVKDEKQSNNINIVKYMDRDEIYNDLFNQLNKG